MEGKNIDYCKGTDVVPSSGLLYLINSKYKMFWYFMIVIANQCPSFVYFVFYGLVGLTLKRFLHFYVALPFLLYSAYQLYYFTTDFIFGVYLKKNEDVSQLPKEPKFESELDVIRARRSVRAYKRRHLSEEHEEFVRDLLKDVNNEVEGIRFVYVKYNFRAVLITDAYQYIVTIVPKKFSNQNIVDVGRYLQGIVHELTRKGIASCWVGGFVHPQVSAAVQGFDDKNDHVGVLCSLGYESTYRARVVKNSYKTSRTRYFDRYLFHEEEWGRALKIEDLESEKWKIVYHMAKWAPSASNDQQTKIVRTKDRKKYHFYKSGLSWYYSKIGIGISMKIWEIACKECGIEGEFVEEDPGLEIPEKTQYFVTWVCK